MDNNCLNCVACVHNYKHIASIIFSYWPILDNEQPPKHFEPSKSSKSMGSVNIIYASDKSRDRTISHNYRARKATLSATDRTASSNKTASREESKSLWYIYLYMIYIYNMCIMY